MSYVDDIAASIVAEVAGADTWTVRKHQPLWVTTVSEATLYVYRSRVFPGEFRTTGTREDIHEIVIEYHEPATDQEDFERSESAEAALTSRADSIRDWADNHQTIGTSHRMDYIQSNDAPSIRRQLLVRAFQIVLTVRDVATYG